jgi:hypothetical protein
MKVGDKVKLSTRYKQYACRKIRGIKDPNKPVRVLDELRTKDWLHSRLTHYGDKVGVVRDTDTHKNYPHNECVRVRFINDDCFGFYTVIFDTFDLTLVEE